MKFSGIQRFTVLDYPGKAACIVFTPGCNFRCGYCHNPEFVLPDQLKELAPDFIDEETVLRFLEGRRGLLDGVVITGGEPTLHLGLTDFIRRVKALGFLVKLDTNGSLPEVFEPMLREGLVDYVAMDVKTSIERYPELTSPCVRPEAIEKSISLIRDLAPDYEFRTTLIRECHDDETVKKICSLVQGAKRFRLQTYRPSVTLDPVFNQHRPFTSQEMRSMGELFQPYVQSVHIDGAPFNA